MQQSINGSYPSIPAPPFTLGLNLEDNSTISSQWSKGTTVIVPVSIAPPSIIQQWSIVGWKISFYGIATPGAPNTPFYGRPGKIIGGIVRGTQRTPSDPSQVGTAAVLPLPSDLSTIETVWDPDIDTAFPWADLTGAFGSGGPRQYTHSEILPTPIAVNSSSAVSMGLWLMPSLVKNYTPNIMGATYTITYDDGR